MGRILIAGCGYVGTALALRLLADGHDVWGLKRDPRNLPPGVRPVAADLTAPHIPARLPAELDAVAYTASADESTDEAYHRAYVKGLDNLLRALDRCSPPRRLLFTSSTAVYAQHSGETVDESSPTEPVHFTGQRVLQGERVLQQSGLSSVVLRCGGIYGPGRTGLIDRVRSGAASYPPTPLYTNRIHREDVAGALRHLLSLRNCDPIYIGVDREPADLRRVLEWLAERTGSPSPRENDRPRASRRYRSNKRCESARLVATGYRFIFPTFREGYAGLLA